MQSQLNPKEIYPAPIREQHVTPTSPVDVEETSNDHHKLPWLKIVLLGIVLEFGVFSLLGVFTISYEIAIFSAVFGGFGGLYLLVHAFASYIAYLKFKRWELAYPHLISSFSFLTLFGLFTLLNKLPSSFSKVTLGYELSTFDNIVGNSGLLLALFIFACVLLFLTLTFITNKLRINKLALAGLIIGIAGLYVFVFTFKTPSLGVEKVASYQDSITAHYLPPGIVDGGKNNTCADQDLRGGAYRCNYYFTEYPGYLSKASQTTIDTALAKYKGAPAGYYYQPQIFFTVSVFPDNPILSPYKFRNEMCDWRNLMTIGMSTPEYRAENAAQTPADPSRCVQVITPSGKTLYYESFLNYTKYELPVPVRFYFEQDGFIVTIGVDYPNPIMKDDISSVYLTDQNYHNEFYKFIDGLK